MTRINLIDVTHLTDQHLFAEYREITRIFSLVKQAQDKHGVAKTLAKIPPTFRLNDGHVLFFYDKLGFIESRYIALRDELLKRGVNITLKDDIIEFRQVIDNQFYQDFTPNQADLAISVERIIEKIGLKPNWYRLNGEIIDDKSYCLKLESLGIVEKWFILYRLNLNPMSKIKLPQIYIIVKNI